MNPVFIAGCGDIGLRVAALWRSRGVRVSALARTGAAAARFKSAGIEPVAGDLDRPSSLRGLRLTGNILYYFAPPPGQGDGDPRAQALAEALTFTGRPARIVYISTSGVYGDQKGALIDEDTPPAPVTARARRRLAAEQIFRACGRAHGVPITILRVSGIYGPGRLPLARLRQGLPVLHPDDAPPGNRIHAEDLAAICLAAADPGGGDALYNVSDGQNTTLTDYFFAVADAMGLPRPPTVTMSEAKQVLTPELLSYYAESRRLDTRRLREELGMTLRYPTLQAGLAAISDYAGSSAAIDQAIP